MNPNAPFPVVNTMPPNYVQPHPMFSPFGGFNPAMSPHDLPTSPVTNDWFAGIAASFANLVLGYFGSVVPAIMTLFAVVVGVALIVGIVKFVANKF